MAKLFLKDKPIIGVDVSTTGIKVMAVDPKRWVVFGYGSIDLDPIKMKESLENNPSYLAEHLQTLLREKVTGSLPGTHAVIGVPTARTYSRTFIIPKNIEKDLEDAVITEVDQYIPLPSSSLSIDYQVIERTNDAITVLMSAVSKSVVDAIVTAVENANLEPMLIEPGISAVSRLLTKAENGHLPTIIVDIGPAGTDIAILDEGFIRVTGSTAVGSNTFTLDIAKKLNVTLDNAHQLKVLNGLSAGPRQEKIVSALQPSLQRIVNETRKVVRYYEERISEGRGIEQLLVVGGGSNVPGIGEYFTDALVMPARVANPWQMLDFSKLTPPAKQFRSRYITVAGLAGVEPEKIWK